MIEEFIGNLANFVWTWNVPILVGSGLFFLLYSKLKPFKYILHAFQLLSGKYSKENDEGEVSHFQALTTALSGTIGLGNIAGVAIAIKLAGPGAIFWMWLTAIVGIATKFFTCSLSVMYREKDSEGFVNGGPMYVIKNGLPKSMIPLAYFFALAGLIGSLPGFQSNQLVQIVGDLEIFKFEYFNLIAGLVLAFITGIIIIGGLIRIAKISEWLVPTMSFLYFGSILFALLINLDQVIPAFQIIFSDAFTGSAVAGGSILAVIIMGVRRGAHSNEAGIGTETLVHGSARTSNPIKQGLVAMLGPIFDTLIMCTATALIIIISGVWISSDSNGVTLTSEAFELILGPIGYAILFICVICFGASTIFTYSYYGSACAKFLFGKKGVKFYQWVIIIFVVVFAVIPIEAAINVIDIAFAMMAVPTLISTIWLSPIVIEEAKKYFKEVDFSPLKNST